jgi:arylformamidase
MGWVASQLLTTERVTSILSGLARRQAERHDDHRHRVDALRHKHHDADVRLNRLYQAIESGIADPTDETLKDRIATVKAERESAKVALGRALSELNPENRVTEDKVASFVEVMKKNVIYGEVAFRRAYLRSVIDRVEVDDTEVRIIGRNAVLEGLVMGGGASPAGVPSFVRKWRANDHENYHFIADTVLAAGAIAVIAEYTLMPGARMAQLVDEVRAAAAWVGMHIAHYGGDAGRLTASGHSAGAHLASYLSALAPHEHGVPAVRPKASLLVSGIYDLRPITTSFLQPEIGLTEEEVNEWSPFEALPAPDTQLTLVVGKDETEPFHIQAQDFAYAAQKRGAPVERLTVPGHDHMTIVRDMGVPGTRMADLLMETIARG